MATPFNARKLAELIVYFSSKSEGDEFFGATKLNKLLFVADFWAYGYLGHSITGTTYIHQVHGPTPSPGEFLPVRDDLMKNNRLQIRKEPTFSGVRQRPIALSTYDLSSLSDNEREICGATLQYLSKLNNRDSSEWSHRLPGWRLTKDMEVIRYETAFIWTKIQPTEDDFEWARQIVQGSDFGWVKSQAKTP